MPILNHFVSSKFHLPVHSFAYIIYGALWVFCLFCLIYFNLGGIAWNCLEFVRLAANDGVLELKLFSMHRIVNIWINSSWIIQFILFLLECMLKIQMNASFTKKSLDFIIYDLYLYLNFCKLDIENISHFTSVFLASNSWCWPLSID